MALSPLLSFHTEVPKGSTLSSSALVTLPTVLRESHLLFLKYLFIYLFIYGCVGSSLLCAGCSLVATCRGYSSCIAWASHCGGFSCCRAWVLGSRAQQLCHMGSVALRHVGSSQTRARAHVPYIGRRIPNHFATREVPVSLTLQTLITIFMLVILKFISPAKTFPRTSYLSLLWSTRYVHGMFHNRQPNLNIF